MGNYNIAQLIEETDLIKKDIQDAVKAVREKGGQADTYATSELADQIRTIPSYVPGSRTTITENGEHWVGEYEFVKVSVEGGIDWATSLMNTNWTTDDDMGRTHMLVFNTSNSFRHFLDGTVDAVGKWYVDGNRITTNAEWEFDIVTDRLGLIVPTLNSNILGEEHPFTLNQIN